MKQTFIGFVGNTEVFIVCQNSVIRKIVSTEKRFDMFRGKHIETFKKYIKKTNERLNFYEVVKIG